MRVNTVALVTRGASMPEARMYISRYICEAYKFLHGGDFRFYHFAITLYAVSRAHSYKKNPKRNSCGGSVGTEPLNSKSYPADQLRMFQHK